MYSIKEKYIMISNTSSVNFTGLAQTKQGNLYNKCNTGKIIGGVTLGTVGAMGANLLGVGIFAPVGIAGGAVVDHFINKNRAQKADEAAKLDTQA